MTFDQLYVSAAVEREDKTFIIKDWANNTLFQGSEFRSFEDAWDFLYNTFNNIDDDKEAEFFGEFCVVEK